MGNDDYPAPVSDPEAEGLPDIADDDSTAYDDVESGREADGADPASLPADGPLAVDRFGVTAEEQRHGGSLGFKLARERSDTPNEDLLAGPGAGLADEGAHPDEEADAVAHDLGAAGGGASAEELAMHEVHPPPQHHTA